jgi:hypothetical protein
MALGIRARLTDQREQPLAGVTVRATIWDSSGRAQRLAEGSTNADGVLALESELELGAPLPRIGLRMSRGTKWVELSDSPVSYDRKSIDFGHLVVGDQPAALLGNRRMFASSRETLAISGAGVADRSIELEALMGQLSNLEQHRNQLLSQIDDRDSKIQALNQRIGMRDSELAGLQKTVTELKDQVNELDKAVEIVSVLQSVGSQVGAAAETLTGANLGMRLGDVSIHLKGISTGDGTKFDFPTKSQLRHVAGAEMSTIDIALHPKGPASPGTSPSSNPKVPKLLGYTELLARRKLTALGFAVEVSHRAVSPASSGPSPFGRVVGQSPAPNAALDPGGVVEILIGMPITNE